MIKSGLKVVKSDKQKRARIKRKKQVFRGCDKSN